MKFKFLAIGIMLMMLSCTLHSVAKLNNNNIGQTATGDIKEIRVAIYSMGDVTYSDMQKYFDIFDGYQWKVGNKIYRFTLTAIDDEGIFKGELNTKNYDVFTIAWMEAAQMTMKLSHPSIKNIIWKNRIADFVKEGGGYFGSCAASIIMTAGLSNRPETFYEKLLDKGSMHISQVKSYIQGGLFFLPQLSGHPEKIGEIAYNLFSGWDENNESAHGGCCLDVVVDKNNPIFNDICGDTRLIRWVSGPAYVLPEQSNNVKVIACYPGEEISDNKSTQIHAWKYTGRLSGFLKGFLKSTKIGGTLFNKLYFIPLKATDWEMTDTIIQTHLADKPLMIMETYPNENQGRIILCGGHPEDKVWWGGHIEEAEDNSGNNLFDSLHYWTNVTKVDDTYNWCIFRREAAWAGKVPDNDLPPIYGASQVSNIYPYNQSSNFTITGNTKEETEGITTLDLYYRYSADASSWSDWTLYGTDTSGSDDWSWEFNASIANGPGYYQFCSIRHVTYENEELIETAPPGPDAIAYVYKD
jgi:hypothetical protein